jgi:hypothetical protein
MARLAEEEAGERVSIQALAARVDDEQRWTVPRPEQLGADANGRHDGRE